MLNLPDITYLSLVPNQTENTKQNIDSIVRIGINSSKNINFGRKVIYTFKAPTIDPQDFEIKIINEVPYEDFNNFVLEFYPEAFDTKFMLNFHSDGFIQNPQAWDDDFLNFDFIGAPISLNNELLIGNGGFSLRSKLFCDEVKKLKQDNFHPDFLPHISLLPFFYKNEDVFCSLFCKDVLLEKGIKLPDFETASRFSTEHLCIKNNRFSERLEDFKSSFGIHEIKTLKNWEIRNYRYELQKQMLSDCAHDA